VHDPIHDEVEFALSVTGVHEWPFGNPYVWRRLSRERLLRRFDLVQTGALIDGDSLLIHALEMCEVDDGDDQGSRSTHGSPPLQIVYTVHKVQHHPCKNTSITKRLVLVCAVLR
jgi:hypothetical protein